ncbi:MAG: aminopeptidase P family protein [Actinomycetaceae bacterium]|nr:aminopeptidase P family protein [Actinomycetaceae bacterium]
MTSNTTEVTKQPAHLPQDTSHDFSSFMAQHWGERPPLPHQRSCAPYTRMRRKKLAQLYPDSLLLIPAGQHKTRSNDTTYRFRAHSAFIYFTGLQAEEEPNSVLMIATEENGQHSSTLFFTPQAPRSSEEFYKDTQYGEFWVGSRPTLEEMNILTGIPTLPLALLDENITRYQKQGKTLRTLPSVDTSLDDIISTIYGTDELSHNSTYHHDFEAKLSSMRLIKDEYEINEMKKSIEATHKGFNKIVANIPQATNHPRGERIIESSFFYHARVEGNGLGYETIAASGNHANTLHFIDNNGPVHPGDLILIDAGVEVDSLYTSDVTRTLPVNGVFTQAQRLIYEAVLKAADTAFEVAQRKGARFKDLHQSAIQVIKNKLEEWEILTPDLLNNQWHRRWMPHGTSHHLGIDVHDCALASKEMYMDALLEPGMIFTIEPGLYFREDDLYVPKDYRGIGIRIEDDILITKTGAVRLSEDIPRTVADVEQWVQSAWQQHEQKKK